MSQRQSTDSHTLETLVVELPPAALEQIASRAAEIVLERLGSEPGSPWMTRTRAAAYLGLPVSRLEKDKGIPCHRDGRRVLYHRAELDEHFGAASAEALAREADDVRAFSGRTVS